MEQLRIIGVPEHFNYPWQLALQQNAFETLGVLVDWEDIPQGTGKMVELLKEEKTDLAIILTEGLIKGVHQGLRAKIIQEYVSSPLLWGIHVASNSKLNRVEDLVKMRVAISRYGSGSHLMAILQADSLGFSIAEENWIVVNDLPGGIAALTKGDADYFLWERFTTLPYVKQGIFRSLGDFPTPWPCFVIAVTERALSEKGKIIKSVLGLFKTHLTEFKEIPSIIPSIASYYNLEKEDTAEWFSKTHWSTKQLGVAGIEKIQTQLLKVGVIDKLIPPEKFLQGL